MTRKTRWVIGAALAISFAVGAVGALLWVSDGGRDLAGIGGGQTYLSLPTSWWIQTR